MKPQSMTGFARSEGHWQRYRWSWELRSVNGKGLDFRLRLPQGSDHLESEVRKRLSGRLSRGNVQVALSIALAESRLELAVNEAALQAVLDLKARLGDAVDDRPLTMEGLLGMRGVAEFREVEESEETIATRDRMILDDLDRALDRLADMRGDEGEKIVAVLSRQIDRIETLTATIARDPSRSPSTIAEKLSEQVAKLVEAAPALDADRLYAEAVLLATKADLQEEIDRLNAHVEAARALLRQGGPCGRRLDFLAQEFNRETNTICSKSNAVAVTAAGLELKTVIDQFREQIQNLE
ncbi:YicC family protein [Martelella lutilitoris]|uniref:YicC family protein n=1 Tax=Martelella lutilitoris TaxID=2583532 RepID=A0A7T7HN38_9HYPH|nr:YicC/YloC family endoribonuclease [Martelella lutilitoris]QQM32273.1 YicC family protein [Martelella lutilitoris]